MTDATVDAATTAARAEAVLGGGLSADEVAALSCYLRCCKALAGAAGGLALVAASPRRVAAVAACLGGTDAGACTQALELLAVLAVSGDAGYDGALGALEDLAAARGDGAPLEAVVVAEAARSEAAAAGRAHDPLAGAVGHRLEHARHDPARVGHGAEDVRRVARGGPRTAGARCAKRVHARGLDLELKDRRRPRACARRAAPRRRRRAWVLGRVAREGQWRADRRIGPSSRRSWASAMIRCRP